MLAQKTNIDSQSNMPQPESDVPTTVVLGKYNINEVHVNEFKTGIKIIFKYRKKNMSTYLIGVCEYTNSGME